MQTVLKAMISLKAVDIVAVLVTFSTIVFFIGMFVDVRLNCRIGRTKQFHLIFWTPLAVAVAIILGTLTMKLLVLVRTILGFSQ